MKSKMNEDELLFKVCEERQLKPNGRGKLERVRKQDCKYKSQKRKREEETLDSKESQCDTLPLQNCKTTTKKFKITE
jgi:hypothetical protein